MTHLRAVASIGLVLLVAAGTVGCATAPPPAPAVPVRALRTATLDEVLAAYDGYCRGLETLSASGDLEVRDRRLGRTRRVGVRVLAGRGGRLYVKGSVAFVTALELVADGGRFWFQVPSKKTVWTGNTRADAAAAEGEGVPYRALRPDDVTTALLPEPLSPGDGDEVFMESDPEAFSVALARAASGRTLVRRRVWLDRQELRPVRLRRYDESGDLQVQAVLGKWEGDSPRHLEIARPSQGYEAVFDLEKVERNPTLPERAFAPRSPEGYTVVEVKD